MAQNTTKKVNRDGSWKISKITRNKICRKCLIVGQPDAILQKIVCFLDQMSAIQLQKTCQKFRRKYFERTGGKIKANFYCLELEDDSCSNILPNTYLRSVKLLHVQSLARWCEVLREIRKNPYVCDIDVSNRFAGPFLTKDFCDQHFRELRKLSLTEMVIGNLDKLGTLDGLRTLNLQGSDVDNVSALGSHKSLHTIILESVPISDISALADCKTLLKLNIARTFVHNVNMMTTLQELDASFTKITEIGTLPNIIVLNLRHTQVHNISALSLSRKLRSLDISHTRVINVDAFRNTRNLRVLNLSWTNVQCVNSLTHVRKLSLSFTLVTDVSALNNVREIDLKGTPVKDVSGLQKALRVNVQNTDVSSVKGLERAKEVNLIATKVRNFKPLLKRAKIMYITPVSEVERRNLRIRGWKLVSDNYIYEEWKRKKK